jgi:hypothetical protein
MISLQQDKACGHCEKNHQLCAMFLVECDKTEELHVFYLCGQCLGDALGAVVTLPMRPSAKIHKLDNFLGESNDA